MQTGDPDQSSSSSSTPATPNVPNSTSNVPNSTSNAPNSTSNVPTSASDPNSTSSAPTSSCDSKFKCNICFDTPVDPVVTVCGHMYCWRCLLAWINHGSSQCPVCKAGVTKSNVIPIYGGGTETESHPASKESQEAEQQRRESKQGTDIPGRPRAERPEPPPQATSRGHGWHSHGVQFGFFPFGVGVQFGGSRTTFMGGNSGAVPLTRDQQRSQFISTALLILGILIIFWATFVEPLLSQFF